MNVTVTDYVDVPAKITELGGIPSDSAVILLPVNFDSAASVAELRLAANSSTLKKLLRQADVPLHDLLERPQRPPFVKNKSSDLVFPLVYIPAALIASAPTIVLNVISSYIFEMLGHLRGDRTAKLSIVVEKGTGKTKTYKRFNYEGPAKELRTLENSIREVSK